MGEVGIFFFWGGEGTVPALSREEEEQNRKGSGAPVIYGRVMDWPWKVIYQLGGWAGMAHCLHSMIRYDA